LRLLLRNPDPLPEFESELHLNSNFLTTALKGSPPS
jgi:hypothetical protein